MSKNTDTADPTQQRVNACLSFSLDKTTPPNNPPPLFYSHPSCPRLLSAPLSRIFHRPPFLLFPFSLFTIFFSSLLFYFFSFLSCPASFFLLLSSLFSSLSFLVPSFFTFPFLFFPFLLILPSPFSHVYNIITEIGPHHPPPPPLNDAPEGGHMFCSAYIVPGFFLRSFHAMFIFIFFVHSVYFMWWLFCCHYYYLFSYVFILYLGVIYIYTSMSS